MYQKTKVFFLSAVAAGILSGCATAPVDRAGEEIEQKDHEATQLYRQGSIMTRSPSRVKVVDELYISDKPFVVNNKDLLPDIFKENMIVSTVNPISLQELISDAGKELGVRTEVTADAIEYVTTLEQAMQEDVSATGVRQTTAVNSFEVIDNAGNGLVGSKVKFSVSYNDSAESYFDYISAKTNLNWKWEDNTLVFFYMDTQTFKIDYLGGNRAFTSSVGSEVSGGSDSEGGSAATGGHTVTTNYTPAAEWESLASTIETIKSATGTYSIDQEAGILTIKDTPRVISDVEEYVLKLNDVITQQIAIKTEIYEIKVDDSADIGIDWAALFNSNTISAGLTTSFTDVLSPNIDISMIDSSSPWANTRALVNALNSVANVSTVTNATAYTTHGIPTPIQNLDKTGYLKNVTREINDEGTRETTGIEQAEAKSGFSLGFLPKITSKGEIMMEFTGDLSQLTGVNDYTFDGITIQSVNKNEKKFQNVLVVRPGTSIMVGGFERIENTEEIDSLGGRNTWMAGGKKSGGQKRVMTLIVLTPYLMNH